MSGLVSVPTVSGQPPPPHTHCFLFAFLLNLHSRNFFLQIFTGHPRCASHCSRQGVAEIRQTRGRSLTIFVSRVRPPSVCWVQILTFGSTCRTSSLPTPARWLYVLLPLLPPAPLGHAQTWGVLLPLFGWEVLKSQESPLHLHVPSTLLWGVSHTLLLIYSLVRRGSTHTFCLASILGSQAGETDSPCTTEGAGDALCALCLAGGCKDSWSRCRSLGGCGESH